MQPFTFRRSCISNESSLREWRFLLNMCFPLLKRRSLEADEGRIVLYFRHTSLIRLYHRTDLMSSDESARYLLNSSSAVSFLGLFEKKLLSPEELVSA